MLGRFFSRFFSSSPANTTMSVKKFVDDCIAENKVIIFSKTWCPYCKRVKALFSTNFPDIKPVVVELDERDDGNPIQEYLNEKTGQRSVPNVFVNKKHVGGCDDTTKSFETGELGKLITAE